MAESPLDQVLENVRAALHGRRAALLERVQRVERALAAYTAALDEVIAREFAREHALAQPKPSRDAARAAAELRDAVLALPELAERPASEVEESPASEGTAARSEAPPRAEAHLAPFVVVGGVPRSERTSFLPAAVRDRIEWIDTTRQGTVAIGNLTQRIKSGRVAGLVLLEGLVGHRHSEPLVAAAREARVPFAYAGKGGKGALERALAQVSERSG